MNKLAKLDPVEMVDAMLREAARRRASDLYLLPGKTDYEIRFRQDGVQSTWAVVPVAAGRQCVARIKVLARLLTYRSQVAQDGSLRDQAKYGYAEFRVAVMPTIHGERATLRVLDTGAGPKQLEDLNFPPEAVAALRLALAKPGGMILLTGPTGCGKTTTIYALVRELLRMKKDPASIISIEDPVECEIPGISQVSVSAEQEGWGYPDALRSALRQDLKTLVIGELRDRDVVKVALDAALTGHLVISSYHAGDIPSVYARLLSQGFEPFLVAATVTCVVAQRLVDAADGGRRVPVAAAFVPDAKWADLLLSRPGVEALRDAVKSHPAADLAAITRRLAEQGVISEKEGYLL